jgi:hypothetical protein
LSPAMTRRRRRIASCSIATGDSIIIPNGLAFRRRAPTTEIRGDGGGAIRGARRRSKPSGPKTGPDACPASLFSLTAGPQPGESRSRHT